MLVKVCGITNLADAELAIEAGADFLGFIFHPPSPRYIAPEAANAIVSALQSSGYIGGHGRTGQSTATVGVFVNRTPDQVRSVLETAGLDYAQLHGDEDPAAVAALQGRAFKALRPTDLASAHEDAHRFTAYPLPSAPQLLVDAYSGQAYGGTGETGDWHIAASLAAKVPRLLLAGGLTPDNLSRAVAAVMPWGVDVSSGVEAEPGRKDPAKVRAFMKAARAVD
jgi:phosphoribosylanthranilate isomerase